jgi:hypothetical protein
MWTPIPRACDIQSSRVIALIGTAHRAGAKHEPTTGSWVTDFARVPKVCSMELIIVNHVVGPNPKD